MDPRGMQDPLLTSPASSRKRASSSHHHSSHRFVTADEQSLRVVPVSSLPSELERMKKRQVRGLDMARAAVGGFPVAPSAFPSATVAITTSIPSILTETVPTIASEAAPAVQTAPGPSMPGITLPTPPTVFGPIPPPTVTVPLPTYKHRTTSTNTRVHAACWAVFEPIHNPLTHKLCGGRCKVPCCGFTVQFDVYHGPHVFDPHITFHRERGELSGMEEEEPESLTEETNQRFHRALAVATVLNHWPVSTCESTGFKVLVKELCPSWVPVSRHTLTLRYIMDLRDKYRVDAVGSLRDSCDFSLHFDAWKAGKAGGSTKHRGFIGITFCTIDKDWNRRVASLTVRRLKGHHDIPAISKLVKEVVEMDYGISLSHLVSTHTDNHNTECGVAAELKSASGVPVMHLRCFNHTLHLAVCDVFDNVEVATNIRDVCHEVVGVFAERRLLSERLDTLAVHAELSGNHVGPTTVVQDVSVRWNSVFNMISRLWLLREEILAALEQEIRSMGNGLSESVSKARQKLASLVRRFNDVKFDLPFLLEILRPCKQASDLMEGDSACASELIPTVDKLERKMKVRLAKMHLICAWCHCFPLEISRSGRFVDAVFVSVVHAAISGNCYRCCLYPRKAADGPKRPISKPNSKNSGHDCEWIGLNYCFPPILLVAPVQ
jgi:hypothetical protein